MTLVARTLALAAANPYQQSELVAAARAGYRERIGKDFHCEALPGDQAPSLDYRNNTAAGGKG